MQLKHWFEQFVEQWASHDSRESPDPPVLASRIHWDIRSKPFGKVGRFHSHQVLQANEKYFVYFPRISQERIFVYFVGQNANDRSHRCAFDGW